MIKNKMKNERKGIRKAWKRSSGSRIKKTVIKNERKGVRKE
jgi:hypothetical protein